jgi:hypothetical protein
MVQNELPLREMEMEMEMGYRTVIMDLQKSIKHHIATKIGYNLNLLFAYYSQKLQNLSD